MFDNDVSKDFYDTFMECMIECGILKKVELGEIDFDEFLDLEFQLDNNDVKFKNVGKVKIEIYSNEGENIPHIHIEGKQKHFSCALCLEYPMYFTHGTHKSILNSSQMKIINEKLKSPSKQDPSKTIWEYAVYIWNSCRDKNFITIKDMPDYSNISGSITDKNK